MYLLYQNNIIPLSYASSKEVEFGTLIDSRDVIIDFEGSSTFKLNNGLEANKFKWKVKLR